jgi:hypothetical protein
LSLEGIHPCPTGRIDTLSQRNGTPRTGTKQRCLTLKIEKTFFCVYNPVPAPLARRVQAVSTTTKRDFS